MTAPDASRQCRRCFDLDLSRKPTLRTLYDRWLTEARERVDEAFRYQKESKPWLIE